MGILVDGGRSRTPFYNVYFLQVQLFDGDAPGRPPPTAYRRRQRPPGRTTAVTAATPGLMCAQVRPHHRPNLLQRRIHVLRLLTKARFAGPGEEVGFAAAGDGLARPSPTAKVTLANAATTMAAVTGRQWSRIKSRWRLQELLARALSAVGWGRNGSRWRTVS
jgi:uncharacterized protein YjiS (DUF1127 family)